MGTVTSWSDPVRALPTPRTRLIGREVEQTAASVALLDTAVPLLTMTGTGGVGKTRLALAVAHSVARGFTDGVVWVDLAAVTDPLLVPETVLSALGVEHRTEEPVADQLVRVLRPRQVLLLLDNCEHLGESVAILVALLLARCPALQVLATSRAPLHIRGEQLLPVEPLSVPDVMTSIASRDIAAFAAVTLFCERARAVRPSFTMTDANASVIAAICRHLDGLPLALELAAAHLHLLPPEALLTQMTHRLELLQHGARDLPQRQRTLDATIAWSYDLLSTDDQRLLRSLAVFVGGWTVEAASGVSGWSTGEVLQGLVRLRDQNLIREMPGHSAARFTMLETIREFGLERLSMSGEDDDVRERHAGVFLALVDRLDAHVFEHLPEAAQVLATLQAEYPNLRAALAQLAAAGPVESFVRLAGLLHAYWINQGLFQEGQHWLEQAVAIGETASLPARVWAQVGLVGMLFGQHGETDRALALLDEAVILARRSADPLAIALATEWRATRAAGSGHLDLAEAWFTEARAAFGTLPPQPWIARNLTLIETGCAWIALGRGDLDAAQAIGTRALDQMRRLEREHQAPYLYAFDAFTVLASVAQARGDLGAAVAHHQDAMQVADHAGDAIDVLYALIRLARTLWVLGRLIDAARLLGASAVMSARLGVPFTVAVTNTRMRPDPDDPTTHGGVASLDQRIQADPILTREWDVGRAWSTAEAIVDAVAIDPFQVPPARTSPSPPTRSPYDLTPREHDVLALLCERLTDPEIAERLFISRRTVSSHVAHLFTKLQVNSRREAAALASRESLV